MQNNLRFYDQRSSDFSVADASRFLVERINVSEDGNRILDGDPTQISLSRMRGPNPQVAVELLASLREREPLEALQHY